mmetsp:Transcript_2048/g.4118  ORF Transcript_2048/g.4118 Transcript_2048/m.4118 type:complete len:201 (+) Transcript_2048:385-987(+)
MVGGSNRFSRNVRRSTRTNVRPFSRVTPSWTSAMKPRRPRARPLPPPSRMTSTFTSSPSSARMDACTRWMGVNPFLSTSGRPAMKLSWRTQLPTSRHVTWTQTRQRSTLTSWRWARASSSAEGESEREATACTRLHRATASGWGCFSVRAGNSNSPCQAHPGVHLGVCASTREPSLQVSSPEGGAPPCCQRQGITYLPAA